MHYIAIADTDIGIAKQTNQDGVLIKYGKCVKGEVLLTVVCDGMGGLEKGEVASAAVIREFARWFEEELPYGKISTERLLCTEKRRVQSLARPLPEYYLQKTGMWLYM